ncbi:MAG TPA: dockerin type I domain-containing protein [Saprospiraceae bacterium]|nr:dockerin type I domain-containing protein [Saprospiraceae bacterium]
MTIKNILITITLLSITFGLQSQTSLISGHIPSAFLVNGEVEIQIINLTQSDTIILTPDASGLYEYNAPVGNDYKVSSSVVGGKRYSDFVNGVSTLDQVLIMRHILAVDIFTSPNKLIAADVNLDGRITSIDLVLARRLILGIIQDFGHPYSWFIRPVTDPTLEAYELINLQSDATGLDFITIKLGDINGTATFD